MGQWTAMLANKIAHRWVFAMAPQDRPEPFEEVNAGGRGDCIEADGHHFEPVPSLIAAAVAELGI
jgi:hypothetical protein